MPIKKEGSKYVLRSPNTGKKLYANTSKKAVVKRAGQIAFFRSQPKKTKR